METKHGRRVGRRSIKSACQRFWNEAQKLRTMERILRKPTRSQQTERIRRKQEKDGQRATRLKRLNKNPDFSIIRKKLKDEETMAIYGLATATTKRDNVSMDYYVGYLNGRISLIWEIRDMISKAIITMSKKPDEENE